MCSKDGQKLSCAECHLSFQLLFELQKTLFLRTAECHSYCRGSAPLFDRNITHCARTQSDRVQEVVYLHHLQDSKFIDKTLYRDADSVVRPNQPLFHSVIILYARLVTMLLNNMTSELDLVHFLSTDSTFCFWWFSRLGVLHNKMDNQRKITKSVPDP
jgi:hypothetical protein